MPKNYVHDDYSEESDANTDLEPDCAFGFHVISDLEDLYAAQRLVKLPKKKKVAA